MFREQILKNKLFQVGFGLFSVNLLIVFLGWSIMAWLQMDVMRESTQRYIVILGMFAGLAIFGIFLILISFILIGNKPIKIISILLIIFLIFEISSFLFPRQCRAFINELAIKGHESVCEIYRWTLFVYKERGYLRDSCYYNTALAKKKPEICSRIKEYFLRAECYYGPECKEKDFIDQDWYVAKAIETRNEKYCKCITSPIIRDECWNYLAVLENKPELCRKFGKKWCTDYAFLQNTDLCKEISIDAVKYDIACQETKLLRYLSIEQDCEDLKNNVDAKKECIKKLALETENIELCKNLFDLSSSCQNELAIRLNDPQKCSEFERDDCITKIAIKNKDAGICKEATNVAKCSSEVVKKFPEAIVEEILLKDEATGWNIYRSLKYGFEFRYPPDFFWEVPGSEPKIISLDCKYANFAEGCPYISDYFDDLKKEEALETGLFTIKPVTINDIPYCFWSFGEGAAGSTYATYHYSTVKNKECFAVRLVLRFTHCGVFGSPEEEAYKECEYENTVTKPEILNQVISTFRFIE